ncbi:hypothetical protein ACFL44_03490 [Gemmatimonadota bacterium]
MTAIAAVTTARHDQARSLRLRVVAVFGLLVSLSGILAGTTPLTDRIPLPSWGLGAAALLGLLLMASSGIRLLQMKSAVEGTVASRVTENPEDVWVAVTHAFEGLRSGIVPIMLAPDSADEAAQTAFAQGNEAFQFLARRQKVVRAAIDDLREELNTYHKYLTRSQVGLIGANSVAERLEDLDKRLAKIRSVV